MSPSRDAQVEDLPKRNLTDHHQRCLGSDRVGSDLEADFRRVATHPQRGSTEHQRADDSDRPNPFVSRARDDLTLSEDLRIYARDLFVLVADFFDTSALYWMQVLNFLGDLFEKQLDNPNAKVKWLGREKRFLDRATRYFTETLGSSSVGTNNWTDLNGQANYEMLREDAQAPSAMFREAINIVMTSVSVESTQQSLPESKRVQTVTDLAFAFAPLSFYCIILRYEC
ncbi:hypothetical protein F5B21DRAFT_506265 [Xylaria acuta]|nr:hypothetical protein F5B21DRAFT_506265 [Xylaria acuta]